MFLITTISSVFIGIPQYECNPIATYNNDHQQLENLFDLRKFSSRENFNKSNKQRRKRDQKTIGNEKAEELIVTDIQTDDKNDTSINDEAKPEMRSLLFQMTLEENLRRTVENGKVKPDWLRLLLERVLTTMQNTHDLKSKQKLRWQSIFYNNSVVKKMKEVLKKGEVTPSWLPPILKHVIEMQNSYDKKDDLESGLQILLSHNKLSEYENDQPEWNSRSFQRILQKKLTAVIKRHEVKPVWLTPLLEYALEEMKNASTVTNEATPKWQFIIFQGVLGKKMKEAIKNNEVKPNWLSQLLEYALVDIQNNRTMNDQAKSEWQFFMFKGVLGEKLNRAISKKEIKPNWLLHILKHILVKMKNTNDTNDEANSEWKTILFQSRVVKMLMEAIRKGKVKPVWLIPLLERLIETQNDDKISNVTKSIFADEKLIKTQNDRLHLENINPEMQSILVSLTTFKGKLESSIRKGEVKPDWLLPLLEYSLDIQINNTMNNETKQKLQLQVFQGVLGNKIKQTIKERKVKPDWLSSLLEHILNAMQNSSTINNEGNSESKVMILKNILEKKLKQAIERSEVKPDWLPDLLEHVLLKIQNNSVIKNDTKSEWQSTIFESDLTAKLIEEAIAKNEVKPAWLPPLLELVLKIQNTNVTINETEFQSPLYYKKLIENQNDDNEEKTENLSTYFRKILEDSIREAIKKDIVKPNWLPLLLKHILVKTQNVQLTNDEAKLEWQSIFGPSGLTRKLKKIIRSGEVKPNWLSLFLEYILEIQSGNVILDDAEPELHPLLSEYELIENYDGSKYFINDEPVILRGLEGNLKESIMESKQKLDWLPLFLHAEMQNSDDISDDLQSSLFNFESIPKQIDCDCYDNAEAVKLPTSYVPSILEKKLEESIKESEIKRDWIPTVVLKIPNTNEVTQQQSLPDDELMHIQNDSDAEILLEENIMESIEEDEVIPYWLPNHALAKIQHNTHANDEAKLEWQFDSYNTIKKDIVRPQWLPTFFEHLPESQNTKFISNEVKLESPNSPEFDDEMIFMDDYLEDTETGKYIAVNENDVHEKQNGIVESHELGPKESLVFYQQIFFIIPHDDESGKTVFKQQPILFQQDSFIKHHENAINDEISSKWQPLLLQQFSGANIRQTESKMQPILWQKFSVNMNKNNMFRNTKIKSQLWDQVQEEIRNSLEEI